MQTRHWVPWLVAVHMMCCGAAFSAQGEPSLPDPAAARSELPPPDPATDPEVAASPIDALAQGLGSAALQALIDDVWQRNPSLARDRHRAAAAAARIPQRRGLPDPVVAWSLFLLTPETRSGPQQGSIAVRQTVPWFGKLALDEQAAWYAAVAAETEVEVRRLHLLTESRRLVHELTFLDAHQGIVSAERSALVRYEKAAQARYAAGTGLQQEIVRIQTQITRADTLLLEIEQRRVALLAQLNGLRDRPAGDITDIDPAVRHVARQAYPSAPPDGTRLRQLAAGHRPDMAAAQARVEVHKTMTERARKNVRPDLTLGLSYTSVGRRRDTPGRANPPQDNGDDILALTGSVRLPVWRARLQAAVDETAAELAAAETDVRHIQADIERAIGDLEARIPLLVQHLRLLETVLLKQAQEALRSAETAYSIGKLNAVDLLDAEVVLFEVQIAAARTRTDLAIAWSQLEQVVAHPLPTIPSENSP